MSKETFETYITVIGQREGKRYVERKYLNIPLHLATGNYERLSDLQVREAMNDLSAELTRREKAAKTKATIAEKCGGYDPFASQIRRSA